MLAEKSLTDEPLDQQRGVVAAEAEGIAHGHVDAGLARLVRHVVEVAGRVGIVEIDRGRQDVVLDRLDAENELRRARRAEQVPGHRLGRADGQLLRVVAEDGLDRLGLGHVADRRRGAVGVDVIDLVQRDARRASACAASPCTAPAPPGAGEVM